MSASAQKRTDSSSSRQVRFVPIATECTAAKLHRYSIASLTQQELTWTTQRQITLTSTFQNAITTLILGFPPSSLSSCTVTRITTLGFFARAFAHSRSIISAFSTSVSRRCMNILRDKWPNGCRTAEKRDELASLYLRVHSITSSARASKVGGTASPSTFAARRLMTRSNLIGACTGRSAGFSPLRMQST